MPSISWGVKIECKVMASLNIFNYNWLGERSGASLVQDLLARIDLLASDIFEVNLLKPTGHVMHHQFNIQQLYVLPTLYLCVLYLSENKQRLVPLTA